MSSLGRLGIDLDDFSAPATGLSSDRFITDIGFPYLSADSLPAWSELGLLLEASGSPTLFVEEKCLFRQSFMIRTVTIRLSPKKAAYQLTRKLLLPSLNSKSTVQNKEIKSPQHEIPQITRRGTTAMSKPRPIRTVTGSCLCNAVQYTCTGSDRGAVLCHCRNCQKGSGSAFAHNYRFLKAKLTFTKGEDMVKEYADKATKTGNTLFRHFCKECGSPIYLRNSAFEGLVVLHTGPMDSTPNGTPSVELFEENRKEWFKGVPKAKM